MSKRFLCCTLCLVWAGHLVAADENPRAPDQPMNPGSGFQYESAFSDYKPYVEQDTASWREQNDKVRGGGHAGHSMDNMKHDMGGEEMKPMMPKDKPDSMNGMDHGAMEMPAGDAKPEGDQGQDAKSEHQHHQMK